MTTPATQTMLEAAERWADANGERHGYSMTVNGAAEVLRQNGLDTTGKELSTLFHDPLADFHNDFPRGTVTFEQVAAAMNNPRGLRAGAKPSLPHPFDRIEERGQFPYPLDGSVTPRVNVDWIRNEWSAHVKKNKIRKGTKRFKEEVDKSRQKVLDAAAGSAREAEAEARKRYDKNIKELDILHDRAIEHRDRAARAQEIRRAFAEVAGVDNPALRQFEELEVENWTDVIGRIEEHAAYMESELLKFQPEEAGRYALHAFVDLRPFVEG